MVDYRANAAIKEVYVRFLVDRLVAGLYLRVVCFSGIPSSVYAECKCFMKTGASAHNLQILDWVVFFGWRIKQFLRW